MTVDMARQEYKKLMAESKLEPAVFKTLVKAKLNGKGEDATPEDYLEAAKQVVAEIQTDPAEQKSDPLPATTFQKETAQILRMKPSRFVCINVQVKSPNHRRELERNKTDNMDMGVESVTIKVTTEHTIVNPKEHAEAKKIVSDVSYKLRKLGMRVQDGVVAVPLESEEAWDETRLDCKKQAANFNRTSTHHKVIVNAIKLQAMVGEEELMARKLAYEIQQIMNEMKDALNSMDPDKIRAVALEAKYRAMNLAPGLQRGALEAAVVEARQNASKIADETKDKTASIEAVKRALDTSAIDSARMMFLDFAVPEEVSESSAVAAGRFSNLELT
jgi:hypothetical protein